MKQLESMASVDESAMQVNAFTVDVEEHFQVAALKSAFDESSWSQQGSRVDANTRCIMDLLNSRNV